MDMQTSFGARGLIMSVFNSFVQQQISREQPLLAKHLGSKGSFSLMTTGATVGCDPYPELTIKPAIISNPAVFSKVQERQELFVG